MRTKEEYDAQLSILRKKRNYHQDMTAKYQRLMDELESDMSMASSYVGKYIKYTPRTSDYLCEYIKVESVSKTQRGFYYHGHVFYRTVNGIAFSNLVRGYWDDLDAIQEITKEEYEATLKELLENFNDFILKEPTDKWLDY